MSGSLDNGKTNLRMLADAFADRLSPVGPGGADPKETRE